MLIIERVVLYDDLYIFFAQWPIEQSKHSIEQYRQTKIKDEGNDDKADEILECHVG